jgi:hypothetical protein
MIERRYGNSAMCVGDPLDSMKLAERERPTLFEQSVC